MNPTGSFAFASRVSIAMGLPMGGAPNGCIDLFALASMSLENKLDWRIVLYSFINLEKETLANFLTASYH